MPIIQTILSAAEVKAARSAMQATQTDFAELVGVHPITVSKWENSRLAPTRRNSALIRALAASPARLELVAIMRPAGVVAALAAGLEYIIAKGDAS